MAQQPQPPGVQLHVERQSNDVRVSWDRESPLVATATGGVLVIADGSLPRRELQLSADALRTGSVLYTPMTDTVQFSLELTVMGSSISVPLRNPAADSARSHQPAAEKQPPPAAGGQRSRARSAVPDDQSGTVGLATFYTAVPNGGERSEQFTAMHGAAPVGSLLRVTNLTNGRSVVVRVVARGPAPAGGRIINVSDAAARELGFARAGTARVRVEPAGN